MLKKQIVRRSLMIEAFSLIVITTLIFGSCHQAQAWQFGGMDQPKTSIEYPMGEAPRDLVVTDISGDGWPDVLTVDFADANVTIRINDGRGAFPESLTRTYPAGKDPMSLFVTDVNGAHEDIIIANSGDDTVTVLLGDGTGNFTVGPGSPMDVGDDPQCVFVADIDGQHPDIITANTNTNTISILLGDGTGHFLEATNSPMTVGESPTSVIVTDVDGNHPDIIVTNWWDDSVTVLLGNGTGQFREVQGSPFDVLHRPSDLVSEDLDDDGNEDVVVSYDSSDYVSIFYGNGSGRFQEDGNSPLQSPRSPNTLFVADANGDGIKDIISANRRNNTVRLFSGDGERHYIEAVNSPLFVGRGPSAVYLEDLNGDTILDIITANQYGNDVSVLFGHGHGGFFTSHQDRVNVYDLRLDGISFSAGNNPGSLHVTGPDIDGNRYILTANKFSNDLSVFTIGVDGVIPGTPTLTLEAGISPRDVVIADIDGGYIEIICVNVGNDTVSVYTGQGSGQFSEPWYYTVSDKPTSVFTWDVNHDGYADIITAHDDLGLVDVLLDDGNGNFTRADNAPYPVGTAPKSVFVVDINNDNDPDILTANFGSRDISLLIGDGSGNFTNASGNPITLDRGPVDIFVMDIDHDNDADIITPLWDSDHVMVLLGDGTGSFSIAKSSPISVGDGPWQVHVGDLNQDGNPDFVTANMLSDDISILLGDGKGDFNPASFSPALTGIEPVSIFIANVTGDELPDIIVTNGDRRDNMFIYEVIIDYDGDGVPDRYDELPTNPTEWRDFDHDLIGNNSDEDDDNDGYPDMTDAFPFDRLEWNDTDHDGIGDNTDLDIDNDTYPNVIDRFPFDKLNWNDTDEDGLGDNSDPDIDGDGHINIADVFPFDKLDWADFDGNGIGDNTDTDIDNDTYLNEFDTFDFDPSEWNDTDGDGIGDNRDLDIDGDGYYNIYDSFAFQGTEWNDTDGDGIGDNTDTDIDNDTIPNLNDAFPLDHMEWSDIDGDRIGDNADVDRDGDNYTNDLDFFPDDGGEWNDTDEDGLGDNTDPDIDNDLVLNPFDAFPFDNSEWNDTDGDRIGDNVDDDIDGDNFTNDIDAFPFDPEEWGDMDGDGIGDNNDPDIDGDGYDNTDDAYPWDKYKYEESVSFFGFSLNVYKLFISSIFLMLYSLLSTGFLYITKRGIFLSGLFVFHKARKVPYYKKEIRKASSIPTLDHIFDMVEDERLHNHLNMEQYGMIREEAEKRRVALTYSVLASLSPEQQFKIFNDIISRDPGMKEQFGKTSAGPGEDGDLVTGTGAGAGVGAAAGARAATGTGVAAKTADVSGMNVDNVHFTVTAPPRVQPKSYFVVDLWAHLEEHQKKVIEQARLMAEGKEELTIRSVGPKQIARGTVLTAKLSIEDMIIEHDAQTILWEGEIGNANYAVKVPEETELGSKQGTASIHIDGLRIAMIHFVIHVTEEAGESEMASVQEIPVREDRIETAFASYARLDRDEVLPRIQGIQKALPSLNIFLDILSLRSGQNWEKEIRTIIPMKDIFYLFWSKNARKSHWVEVEWRCALETRGIDFIDPIPLVSPEVVPPPPELSEKHFDDWTLAFTRTKN